MIDRSFRVRRSTTRACSFFLTATFLPLFFLSSSVVFLAASIRVAALFVGTTLLSFGFGTGTTLSFGACFGFGLGSLSFGISLGFHFTSGLFPRLTRSFFLGCFGLSFLIQISFFFCDTALFDFSVFRLSIRSRIESHVD